MHTKQIDGAVQPRDASEFQFGAASAGAEGLLIRQMGVMQQTDIIAQPFFTERSLAAYLSVSDRTVRDWIRRGQLPSYKLGGSRRIDPADVGAFLAARREAGRQR